MVNPDLRRQGDLRELPALSCSLMITTSISDVLWWDEEQVHLRPFEEIPEEVRWAIESITETQTPMGPKREIKLVSRLQAIKLRAQLERRLAPDGQVTFNQQNNFYSAIPVDIRGLPPETLEKLMAHAQELEALGVLPTPKALPGGTP